MKKYSWLLLVVIISLGIFLRIYNIDTNYYFSGELGKELLYLRQIAVSNNLPLAGMQTSHEWLRYGPFYYYLMLPIFNLFKGNPFILFGSALTVSAIGLILNYFVINKITNTRVAILSTLLQMISPLMIWQTRLSKLHVFFWILIPLFMYSLFQIWNGKKKWVLWSGILFGLMFSFHFSQIPLMGLVIGTLLIKRKLYQLIDWVKFALGVFIANIPLVVYDFQNGFTMTKDLVLWIPYRVLGFAGLYPKNNFSDGVVGATLFSFNEFLGKAIFWSDRFWILGSVIFLILLSHFVWSRRKQITKDFLTFFLTASATLVFLANIIHSAPPVHYFLPVFTIPSVLFAIYLQKNLKISTLLLIGIFIINFNFYFKFDKPDDFVSYSKQNDIASELIIKAEGEEFSITRIGPYDHFPENYSQNYKYLILWKGGNLTDDSNLIYTIDETK